MPEFQGKFGVAFSVLAHIHGGEFPEFFLGMYTKVRSRLLEALFRFDFLDVVKAKRIEAV